MNLHEKSVADCGAWAAGNTLRPDRVVLARFDMADADPDVWSTASHAGIPPA